MIENPFAPDKWRIGQDTGCVHWPFRPFDDFGAIGRWLTMVPAFQMVADRVWDTGDAQLAELLLGLADLIHDLIPATRVSPGPYSTPFLVDRNPFLIDWNLAEALLVRLASFGEPWREPWLRMGLPIWVSPEGPGQREYFNSESWRYFVGRMVRQLTILDNQHRYGIDDMTQVFDIVKSALVAVAVHDDNMRVTSFEQQDEICAEEPSEDTFNAMGRAGTEWWDRYRLLLPTRGAPSEIVGGLRPTTGVLQKCKDPYEKSGRPWCIYKHRESDWDEPLTRQPKGWPIVEEIAVHFLLTNVNKSPDSLGNESLSASEPL